jgi:fructan beta-fructosidase
MRAVFYLTLFFSAFVLNACRQTAEQQSPTNTSAARREQHRPQFHFSPPTQWMNDPNGMFYYEGEYHLFYQYYPDRNVWGPMHWGHAVSTDLAHWQDLPIALYPDSLGYIFSGSAVVDQHNTSGLGTQEQPPIVAIFTYHYAEGERAGRNDFQYQGIAYSTDKGRTWTKYAGNPVIPNTQSIRDFRDPKVLWHEASQQWVMVFAAYDHLKFWGSKNLLQWRHLSDFGKEWGSHAGVWECPDLFPMQVEASGETQWALLCSINPGGPNGGSGTQYFIGQFDGEQFELDATFAENLKKDKAVWLDYGRDNYAGVTWSGLPDAQRRLFLGWMSNWDYAQVVPTTAWRSAMTLPRDLRLLATPNGHRIASWPAPELLQLRTATHPLKSVLVDGRTELALPAGVAAAQTELELEWELPENGSGEFGVELSNSLGETYRIGYNIENQQFYSDRRNAGKKDFSEKFAAGLHLAPRIGNDKVLRMRLYLDAASVEMFADNGATALTDIFFPNEDFQRITLYAEKGSVKFNGGKVYPLRRIWDEGTIRK